MKHEGIKTVVFIGIILLMGVIITGMFLENQTMVIVGVAILLAAALIASVILVMRLTKRYRGNGAPVSESVEEGYEREKERSERRRAPVREILKSTLLVGGFLTSCVLFVVLCSIKEFVLACIVWGSGVGLTLFAFIIMLIRESIQKSNLSRFGYERSRAREQAEAERERQESFERDEREEYANNQEAERDNTAYEPRDRFYAPVREKPRESGDLSGRYRLVEAAVRSVEFIESRDDTVDFGGQPLARRYGLYRVVLQAGGETKTAVSAVQHRRGEFVDALFGTESDAAVIVTGSEIKLGSGRYRQACGKVRMCIVDIATMVDKRRKTGDAYSGERWAVDPDYRFIITADVGGKRVRCESEIYYTEGTSVDLLECRGNAVAVFVD